MPAIGAKECIFNLNLAFLDPGDVALAADPGYPVYTGGPLLAGAEPVLMPLRARTRVRARPRRDRPERARASAADVPQLPEQPDRRDRARRPVRARSSTLAGRHDVLAVHDNAYSETTYDGYVAPSFLATPGAKDVGVEVFSLSKGYNMTGWRCAAIVGNAEAISHYWRLKSNIDSGLFDAIQLAGAAALAPEVDAEVKAMNDGLPAPSRSRLRRARPGRRPRHAAEGDDLRLGAGPRGLRVSRGVLRARARAGRRGDLPRRRLRAERRGLLPDLADHARRAAARGRRALCGGCNRIATDIRSG